MLTDDPLFKPNAIGILKLVSGLPKPVRERRKILALQAFIDDSRTNNNVLVLSGFIADAVAWAKFSDEWQDMLNKMRWNSFKMSSLGLGGGDETTEYAEWYFRIIEKHVEGQIAVLIDEKILCRLVDELKMPKLHKNPYYYSHWWIIEGLLMCQRKMNFWEPVDIIFDEQVHFQDIIIKGWSDYKADTTRPRDIRVLGETPRFANDEKFLPLQAADLSAWWLRKHWEKNGRSKNAIGYPYPWPPKKYMKAFVVYPSEASLKRMLRGIKKTYIEQSWEFADKRGEEVPEGVMDFPDSNWDTIDLRHIRPKPQK